MRAAAQGQVEMVFDIFLSFLYTGAARIGPRRRVVMADNGRGFIRKWLYCRAIPPDEPGIYRLGAGDRERGVLY